MRKALVTGAAGFIGSTLSEELQGTYGVEVVAVDSFTDYYNVDVKRRHARELHNAGISVIDADLNCVDLDSLLSGVDVVFHLAGQPGVRASWGRTFDGYLSNNVAATQRLLEAVKSTPGISRLVYASSSSIYGDAERYPTVETDLPLPFSPYGVTKLAAEHLMSLYARNFGVPTVSLRYFTVYGPRQRPDMGFTRFLTRAFSDVPIEVFGSGEQVRDFTYVGDIVAANIAAAVQDVTPGSVFNVSGGSSVSVNEVLEVIASVAGRNISVDRVGKVAGDVFQTGGNADLAGQRLNWRPEVDLETGIQRQADWISRNIDAYRQLILPAK